MGTATIMDSRDGKDASPSMSARARRLLGGGEEGGYVRRRLKASGRFAASAKQRWRGGRRSERAIDDGSQERVGCGGQNEFVVMSSPGRGRPERPTFWVLSQWNGRGRP